MAEVIQLWSPLIQGGFAVFALLLLGVNVWLVKQLLKVLKDNSQVIAGNTQAIVSVAAIASDTKELMQEIRDELWKRPCLLEECGEDEDETQDGGASIPPSSIEVEGADDDRDVRTSRELH